MLRAGLFPAFRSWLSQCAVADRFYSVAVPGRGTFVKLLVLWVAAAFLSLTFASLSAPVYAQSKSAGGAQSKSAGGNASQSPRSGKTSRTGSTSRKQ
jgi:hypothetical protein